MLARKLLGRHRPPSAVSALVADLHGGPASAARATPTTPRLRPGRRRPDRRRLRHHPARRQAARRRLDNGARPRPRPRSRPSPRPAAAPSPCRAAPITRPNGSGAGKAPALRRQQQRRHRLRPLLVGAERRPRPRPACRPSRSPSTRWMVVVQPAPSHAPATLTAGPDRRHLQGHDHRLGQLGGTAGTIQPKIPQAGSGTRTFFTAQLQAANGGVARRPRRHRGRGPGARPDTRSRATPTRSRRSRWAEPSSLGTTLRHREPASSADRALYNVVRGADVGQRRIQACLRLRRLLLLGRRPGR